MPSLCRQRGIMAFKWFKREKSGKSQEAATPTPDNELSEPGIPAVDGPDTAVEAMTGCAAPEAREADPPAGTGFLKRLKSGLAKTRASFSSGLDAIFSNKNKIDDDLLEELEELLITSDIGFSTAQSLIEKISETSSSITDAAQLKIFLKDEIASLLLSPPVDRSTTLTKPHIIMVVGVNGVGKTTTIGKLAAKYTAAGKSVLIAAADTFRAAAIEQLTVWSQKAGADIIKHKDKADPSAVVYDSLEAAIARNVDMVMIDTAGRLHTKVNLMEELKKIKRTIARKIPDAPHEILLILDATTGQNALSQAKLFDEALAITGLAVTKLDGTAKGGVVVSISHSMKIPIKFIGVGEKLEDLQSFDPKHFVDALF